MITPLIKQMRGELPFADVEDAGPPHDHGLQLVLQTGLRHVLQAPVPVVVVVGAEIPRAAPQLQPDAAIEREPHVVLAADPRRHFRLQHREPSVT
jgi:hypothetical protein